jgi:extracellular factor (EF) 3-hydroxypalmitic acid methyl ester biosynthesis protein
MDNIVLGQLEAETYSPAVLRSVVTDEQCSLGNLRGAVRTFTMSAEQLYGRDDREAVDTARALLDQLAETLNSAQVEPAIGRASIQSARQMLAQSPLLARLQQWPRGYIGDFETIEYICSGTNQGSRHSLGFLMEEVALTSPIIQQHRNKISFQRNKIIELLNRKPNARILSVGCGGSLDLLHASASVFMISAQVFVSDIDGGALQLSSERLHPLCTLTTIPGNLLRNVRKFEAAGPFDLVFDRRCLRLFVR